MRILFLGDVVGRSGRKAVLSHLPALRKRYRADFVIINGENAAGGFGITETICEELLDAGADVITLGNHAWDQREALVFIARQPRLIRPVNFPAGTPGRGSGIYKAQNGAQVMVINAMGRIFMDALDCPFQALDRELGQGDIKSKADAIILDFHAEATSEKQAMGHYVDGRATAVIGTHTHVPTADDHIMPGGTAFMSDVGMCGDYHSVIGMQKEEPVQRFVHKIQRTRIEPAIGEATISGLAIETDDATGLASAVAPFRIGGCLRPVEPVIWVS
jgi:2',3'-cyclic-nucleotide 2'-phosphodiesterase